jgi:hypothetical protein
VIHFDLARKERGGRMEIGRREFLTGLAAVAVAGVALAPPTRAAASAVPPGPPAPPVHRLFLRDDDPATRWQFLEPVTDYISRNCVNELMPSSLWDFDGRLAFEPRERLFSIRHVASGITLRQVHPGTSAVRFDYWDMTADERPTWVDTTDIAIIGDAAVFAVAAIFGLGDLAEQSPCRVRFWPAPFFCLGPTLPIIADFTPAPPLDYYPHVED